MSNMTQLTIIIAHIYSMRMEKRVEVYLRERKIKTNINDQTISKVKTSI